MRITLLNPPFKPEMGKFSRASRSPAITKSGTLYYPIWLAYACGVLENAGFEVDLIDSCAKQMTMDETAKRVLNFSPQLIVLDTSTPSILNDIQCATILKKENPKAITCFVGTHPTVLPDEVLDNSDIDLIVRHEYDETLLDLAQCIDSGRSYKNIAGISYKNDEGASIHNSEREYIANLDNIPFVSSVYKKHLDLKDYFFSAAEYPMIMIMTGRGCPAKCFFCVYPQTFHGHNYRLRSSQNVVDEFEYIVNNFPEVKSIGIEDDTFTAKQERVQEICKEIIKRNLNEKINWWANTRVNLSYDTMLLMKKAGCRLIIPGFESGSQQILNNIRKGIKVEQSIEYMKNAKKAGLLVHGCFMVGNAGETRETMEETLQFAIRLNPDTAQFFPLIPYPGTEAYSWAKKEGYLKNIPYSKWLTEEGMHECVLDLPGISSKELVDFCNSARKRYYLRFSYILYKIKQSILSDSERKRTWKSFKQFYKFLFK